uniref:Transmembrane protein 254 n=1 Tax=Leptobrachium leishanense TaxID=445787 RepID=A0A8C5R0C9_9ANUR
MVMAPSAAAAAAAAASYFRTANVFWMAVITLSMGYFTASVFIPEYLPLDKMGPLGSFTEYLVTNYSSVLYYGYWWAWTIHVVEALYSIRLCRALFPSGTQTVAFGSKGITDTEAKMKWLIQTFLFGIASLSILLNYKPKIRRNRN